MVSEGDARIKPCERELLPTTTKGYEFKISIKGLAGTEPSDVVEILSRGSGNDLVPGSDSELEYHHHFRRWLSLSNVVESALAVSKDTGVMSHVSRANARQKTPPQDGWLLNRRIHPAGAHRMLPTRTTEGSEGFSPRTLCRLFRARSKYHPKHPQKQRTRTRYNILYSACKCNKH